MENYQSQEKYLEVLMTLNDIRIVTYRKMTQSIDRSLQKLFARFSMDSMKNASELEELLTDFDGRFAPQSSMQSDTLLRSNADGSEDVFERCREAEWRLLRYY